jgi:hypothetical protein
VWEDGLFGADARLVIRPDGLVDSSH